MDPTAAAAPAAAAPPPPPPPCTKVGAYLERIKYSGPRHPSGDTLRQLHLAHMLAVPFENLDVIAGRGMVLQDPALFAKIVAHRRGGLCYELNGAFGALLRALGFSVRKLAAGVWRPEQGAFGPLFDHMLLLVEAEGGGEAWLADVGFGKGFREPLRLAEAEEQVQAVGRYRLVEAPLAPGEKDEEEEAAKAAAAKEEAAAAKEEAAKAAAAKEEAAKKRESEAGEGEKTEGAGGPGEVQKKQGEDEAGAPPTATIAPPSTASSADSEAAAAAPAAEGDAPPPPPPAEKPRRLVVEAKHTGDRGWVPQYRFSTRAYEYAHFADMCQYHQTSPQSRFTQKRLCSMATSDGGRVTLTDAKLVRSAGEGPRDSRDQRQVMGDAEVARVLKEEFGIVLDS